MLWRRLYQGCRVEVPKNSAYIGIVDATIEAMDLLGAGRVFQVRERSSREFWRQIEIGLPVASAEMIIKRVPSTVRGQWRTLIYSNTNQATLTTEESEKTGRLAYVLALSKEVWGSWPASEAFLTKSHEALGGKTPIEATKSEWGSREVEALLRKIQFGLPA